MNATVIVRTLDGEELDSDRAVGNTQRAALAAGHALGKAMALEASENTGEPVRYSVSCGAIIEVRQIAVCYGHESTDGPIGNVVYCDGTCRS